MKTCQRTTCFKISISLSFLILLLVPAAKAQEFSGYRTGNYAGVNGVFFNPASMADSRHRFDINLFSFHTGVANNQASFGLSNMQFSADNFEDQLTGMDAGPTSAIMSFSIHGPSVMLQPTRKMAFALTTRGRFMSTLTDIDGRLLDKISSDINNNVGLPYTISSSSNMRMNVNAWTEFGASAARVLYDKGTHFIKGGITLKYLAGAGNGYISIDNLNAHLDYDAIADDVYMDNATGRISMGFGGVNLSTFETTDVLSDNGSGLGADIGFVYEYRPNAVSASRRDLNKYKVRAGLAFLDLGSIRYNKDMQRSGGYTIGITGAERFYMNQLSNADIDGYRDVFESNPQYFTEDADNSQTSYRVSLPSLVQMDVDYHLHSGFYVNMLAQFPANSKKEYNGRVATTVGITPRYERKSVGVYLPVYYNSLSDLNAGLSLRLGPVFFGSGSFISALAGKSKQVDMHFGLRFGGGFKKPK